MSGVCGNCGEMLKCEKCEPTLKLRGDNMSRTSTFGFHCSHCGDFTYFGYDLRDKKGLPGNGAVCLKCGELYEKSDQNIKKGGGA